MNKKCNDCYMYKTSIHDIGCEGCKMSRRDLRGRKLDRDCKTAKISKHEYGVKDGRCFCYGLTDGTTEAILDKCLECKAFVDNAEPLKNEEV